MCQLHREHRYVKNGGKPDDSSKDKKLQEVVDILKKAILDSLKATGGSNSNLTMDDLRIVKVKVAQSLTNLQKN